MRLTHTALGATLLLGLQFLAVAPDASGKAVGWLDWRGPRQNGVSYETGLPQTWALGGANDLWSIDLSGRGAPVLADGKLYVMGYRGEGPDLQEFLVCLNPDTGKTIWEKAYNDFISDTAYNRYALSSPAVDEETGNVYALSSAGIFSSYTPEGKLLWQHSMMEKFGKLTFTNGRTGGPFFDDDLVMIRGITSNWGGDGAAQDRIYAFDKKTGGIVWAAGPGAPPKDNSFARPVFTTHKGKRVLYTGTGDGSVIGMNARTGQLLWRYPISAGGFNSSVVLHNNDKVIAIQADENLDSSEAGRMTAIKIDVPDPKPGEPVVLTRANEAWRNNLEAISSSPVLVGDRIYQTTKTGQLCSVDANTGKVLWEHKLAPDQLHASPLYADGKLYVPMQNGTFFILQPSDTGVKELARVQLAGNCLGAPAVWNGKLYVHTTEKLYCFGSKTASPKRQPMPVEEMRPKPGKAVALQIIPSEVLLRPGQAATFTIRGIDANGFPTGNLDATKAKWESFIPPTARVRSEMNATFNDQGVMMAASDTKPSAGAFQATLDGLKGTIRGRVMPVPPQTETFNDFDLSVAHETETDVKFAYPPLPWIGARFKWEVRDVDGEKALAKTLDNIFFQRSIVFFGRPEEKGYIVEADVRSDGNRRIMSSVGLINQRYLVALEGNGQRLEVTSNAERVRQSVPFAWQPRVWYRMKTRVDVAPDGSGVVRAKAWKRGEPEPEAWTIEVPHKIAHASGSPGFFGFAPQSMFRVYVDNLTVTPVVGGR